MTVLFRTVIFVLCTTLGVGTALAGPEQKSTSAKLRFNRDLTVAVEAQKLPADVGKCGGLVFVKEKGLPVSRVADTVCDPRADPSSGACALRKLYRSGELECENSHTLSLDRDSVDVPQQLDGGHVVAGFGEVWMGSGAIALLPQHVGGKLLSCTITAGKVSGECEFEWGIRSVHLGGAKEAWLLAEIRPKTLDWSSVHEAKVAVQFGGRNVATTLSFKVRPCAAKLDSPGGHGVVRGAMNQRLRLFTCPELADILSRGASSVSLEVGGQSIARAAAVVSRSSDHVYLNVLGVRTDLPLNRVDVDVVVAGKKYLTVAATITEATAKLTTVEYSDSALDSLAGGAPSSSDGKVFAVATEGVKKAFVKNRAKLSLPGSGWCVQGDKIEQHAWEGETDFVFSAERTSNPIYVKAYAPKSPAVGCRKSKPSQAEVVVRLRLADGARPESVPVKLRNNLALHCNKRTAKDGEVVSPTLPAVCKLSLSCKRGYGAQVITIEVVKTGEDAKSVKSVERVVCGLDMPKVVLPSDATAVDQYKVRAFVDVGVPNVVYRPNLRQSQPTSAPTSEYSFEATVRPRGSGHIGSSEAESGARVYGTFPIAPFALRAPASRARLVSSQDNTRYTIGALDAGFLVAVEPWNFDHRSNAWPIPVRFAAGGLLLKQAKSSLSFIAGPSITLPLVDAPGTLGSSVSISVFYEYDVDTRQSHALFALSADILKIGPQ